MPRTIEYIGEQVEITDYEEAFRPQNQTNIVNGIPVDPVLRPDFDMTPNEMRELQEKEDWWGQPFIVTCNWDDMSETWEEYSERLSKYDMEVKPKEEFIKDQARQKEGWFKGWPSGTRYEVRCLDGGAWDRSTGRAMVATFEQALEIAVE